VVGNLKILHNTILSKRPIRITLPEKPSGPIIVANNAMVHQPRIPKHPLLTSTHNITGIKSAFPFKGDPAIGAAHPDYLTKDDFNGIPRGNTKDAGAYKYSEKGDSGWDINKEFKEVPSRKR